MKKLFSFCFVCFAILPAKAKLAVGPVQYNLRDFGAVPNDNIDDSKALKAIFQKIQSGTRDATIIIPTGRFHFDKGLNIKDLRQNISLLGEKGAVIELREQYLLRAVAYSEKIELDGDLLHGVSELKVKEGSQTISKGDLVHISSESVFETGWNYKENDIMRIRAVIGRTLVLEEKINFNYNQGKEKIKVVVYKPLKFNIQDINVEYVPSNPKTRMFTLSLVGFKVAAKSISLKYSGDINYFHDGIHLAACEGIGVENMEFKGLQYGMIFSYCRNIRAEKTKAYFTRHAYVPSVATVGVHVKDLYGYRCHSVMDAHVAFNVTYENVVDTLATKFPGCRALGSTIINARIYPAQPKNQLYAYWSVQTLVKEYNFLYGEYDNRFNNVMFVSKTPGSFNGLNSFTCRNLLVENCTTHSVSYYGDQGALNRITIRDSKVGFVRTNYKLTIVNTIMDGSLFPGKKSVFRISGSGIAEMDRLVVQNYDADSTVLFEDFHNNPRANGLKMKDCDIQPLLNWTNKMNSDPKAKSNRVEISNSRIKGFKTPLPEQMKGLNEKVENKEKF